VSRLAAIVAVACGLIVAVAGCGSTSAGACATALPKTAPAPQVELTSDEKSVWAALPPDRSKVPIVVYHGIGSSGGEADDADSITEADFAKQLTLIKHAGYQTISLSTFDKFVHGGNADLPPRPLLLTFDDGRASSWTGGDEVLRDLGYTAVLFLDTGRVSRCEPGYLTWEQLKKIDVKRWTPQLHAGANGHSYIKTGSDETGPFYAYEKPGESFKGWQKRTQADIDQGERSMAEHVDAYKPLAFALPYGSYGQDGTNNPDIPDDLLGYLTLHYPDVFTLDGQGPARSGQAQPVSRIYVTRQTTGGELHSQLVGEG
jgi:hypothetical protein